MRILAREKGNVGWVPLDSVSYSQEAELQGLEQSVLDSAFRGEL